MASASGAAELLARVTGLLDAAGIPYMLTGSFASTQFGAPRTHRVSLGPEASSHLLGIDAGPVFEFGNGAPDIGGRPLT